MLSGVFQALAAHKDVTSLFLPSRYNQVWSFFKEYGDSQEHSFNLLKDSSQTEVGGIPDILPSTSLNQKRLWYLYDKIRNFCSEAAKDVTCPRPQLEPVPSREEEEPEATDLEDTPADALEPRNEGRARGVHTHTYIHYYCQHRKQHGD